ncbi:MAG: hypothetical protein ABW109_18630, partial [Candidatus Thiodiazotropha sp. 6PLUC4]
LSSDCTNCGRCIDICAKEVFSFGGRRVKKIRASKRVNQINRGVRV